MQTSFTATSLVQLTIKMLELQVVGLLKVIETPKTEIVRLRFASKGQAVKILHAQDHILA